VILAITKFTVNFKVGELVVLNTLPNQRAKATTVTLGLFVFCGRVRNYCSKKRLFKIVKFLLILGRSI